MPKKEMPHSMPSDIKNTSPEFPPDELLIFIGHSDDASAEANAIKALESEIAHLFAISGCGSGAMMHWQPPAVRKRW